MRTIKLIFNRYTLWVWGLLAPLGAWGVFGIGFIDAALWGMPLDAVVAGYVYANHRLAWLYILMAATGSALGSSVIYVVGQKGGELLLEKRVGQARMERMRQRFERHEFLALALPSMLPPPAPFKAFLLAAAVFQMRFRDYLLAIFAGRVVRFSILALLTLWLGPQAVSLVAGLVRNHLAAALTFLAAMLIAIALWQMVRLRRKRAASH